MSGPSLSGPLARQRVPGPTGVSIPPLAGSNSLRGIPVPGGPAPAPSQTTRPANVGAGSAPLPPFLIHLSLAELAKLEVVEQHGRSGLIRRGAVFNTDPKRPRNVLTIVQAHFAGLGKGVMIRAGSGGGSDRFLKADFAWGQDPDVGGVSAQGITRTKLGRFNKKGADQGLPVTGYVFEGVIGRWIVDYMGGAGVNVDCLFATVVAHELGHQLGLPHEPLVTDLMFGFGGGGKKDRVAWLWGASKGTLVFSKTQVGTMRGLLAKP